MVDTETYDIISDRIREQVVSNLIRWWILKPTSWYTDQLLTSVESTSIRWWILKLRVQRLQPNRLIRVESTSIRWRILKLESLPALSQTNHSGGYTPNPVKSFCFSPF